MKKGLLIKLFVLGIQCCLLTLINRLTFNIDFIETIKRLELVFGVYVSDTDIRLVYMIAFINFILSGILCIPSREFNSGGSKRWEL